MKTYIFGAKRTTYEVFALWKCRLLTERIYLRFSAMSLRSAAEKTFKF